MKDKQKFIEALNIQQDGDGHWYIAGSVHGSVEGDVWGSVLGDVKGNVWGDVLGSVKGTVWGTVFGKILGESNDEAN